LATSAPVSYHSASFAGDGASAAPLSSAYPAGQPTASLFTHDAMGDGEDGPTHQPVEQLISLRAIPSLVVLRPGDANEVVEAYRYVIQLRHQPAVIALSRQVLPTFDRTKYASAAGVVRGAYVMADAPHGPEVILLASGSELFLAVAAHETLSAEGIRSRLVSMPSWDLFEHQPESYRERVLPSKVTVRIAVEQGSVLGWDRLLGDLARSGVLHHDDRSAVCSGLPRNGPQSGMLAGGVLALGCRGHLVRDKAGGSSRFRAPGGRPAG
jgi:transketolase